jgi:hypothetical protein
VPGIVFARGSAPASGRLCASRDQVLTAKAVDANVVVVDQLAQFRRDRQPDLALVGESREPRPELLDRLQLGGPRRHLFVVLGVLDRHRRLLGKGGHRLELVRRPVVGRVVVDVQETEDLVLVEKGRGADRVEPFLNDCGPNVDGPRVVAIARREQRPPCRSGMGRQ